jgi:hypothetical protein
MTIDNQERQQCPDSDMSAAFDRAQDLGAMFSEGSTSFVELFVARVAQQHRLLTADNGTSFTSTVVSRSPKDYSVIMETAERGFALIERLNKAGDPSLRLEKYLLEWVSLYASLVLTSGRDSCSDPAGPGVGAHQ